MKTVFLYFLIALVTLATILVFGLRKSDSSIEINGKYFSVDVAKTDLQKEKGLSVYSKLAQDKGMIFPYEKSDYYTFWMKDMKFPIDIIYIDNGKIVDIFRDVPQPKSVNESLKVYKPRSVADLVLEINAGLSDIYGFKLGDLVKVNYRVERD